MIPSCINVAELKENLLKYVVESKTQDNPIHSRILKAKLELPSKVLANLLATDNTKKDAVNILMILPREIGILHRNDERLQHPTEVLTGELLEFFRELESAGLNPKITTDSSIFEGTWWFTIAIPNPKLV
jgi:hypothetical protein